MARPFDAVKELGTDPEKSIYKIGVRIVDLWTVTNKIGQDHLECILMDEKGDTIQAIIPTAHMDYFKPKLKEKLTYIIQNFTPKPNDLQLKVSEHHYKLFLDSGVSLRQKDLERIPHTWFNFKDFKSILNGKVKPDFLVDVIGAVHEITYFMPTGNKSKASFSMRNLTGEVLNCTLWNEFAMRFINYYRENAGCGSIVIILTHAKIRQDTAYPASVSNWWHGSKLLINEDIEEINYFKKDLPKFEIVEASSQTFSQFTGSTQQSQGGDEQKFMKDAEVLNLSQINSLEKPVTCVTIATTHRVEPSPNGWSYEGCTICTKKVIKSTESDNYYCKDGHISKTPKRRYKLEITVVDKKDRSKFMFWDSVCADILGITADQLMKKMFDEDEDDEKAFPLDLEKMRGITAAFRVSVQPSWKQSSVSWIWKEPELIQQLREKLEPDEETSMLKSDTSVVGNNVGYKGPGQANDVKGTSDVMDITFTAAPVHVEKTLCTNHSGADVATATQTTDDINFQTQDLSATGEFDPLACITPCKRLTPDPVDVVDLNQEIGMAKKLCEVTITQKINKGKLLNENQKDARSKRKMVIDEKLRKQERNTKRNRNNKENPQHLINNLRSSTPPSWTPLANITNIPQFGNVSKSDKTIYTQSMHPQHKRRKTIGIHNVGINLMTKYSNISQAPPDLHGSAHQNSYNTIEQPDDNQEDGESEGLNSESGSDEGEGTTMENLLGQSLSQGYSDIGDPSIECGHCHALMFYQERVSKYRHSASPQYHLCCGRGKVQLPPLKQPPPLLQHLLFTSVSQASKNFQQNIRLYNMMFAFTSPGAKLDNSLNNGRGPPVIRIQGQPCHRIGSLLPLPGRAPLFAQLYIYDTENEVKNRCAGFRNAKCIDPNIVKELSNMLDQHNRHAKCFRMARDKLREGVVTDLKLKLISNRSSDGRLYNLPTVPEIAALIVGDVDSAEKRDIILEEQDGKLIRIDELHTSYLGYQYPMIFPYGEDGYRHDVCYREGKNGKRRNRVTIRDWFSYRLQCRKNEPQTILRSRRLFQQFLVDGYSMMESDRLSFIRKNQAKLRVHKYRSLNTQKNDEESQQSNQGKRIILPSTYVGSRRFMDQLYFDGMAICSAVGFPDLFITFTCNPNWPEIKRVLQPLKLNPEDRPDLISRIFKIKFDELIHDLTKNHVLGKVVAYLYTIEFQKRGLPHAHLLIFLHPSSKYPTAEDVDKIISAEIPDEQTQGQLYIIVKNHMIHGPCGNANKSSPCMKDGKCSKYYPKKFQLSSSVDDDGYPVYRRRDNGRTIIKNGVTMDNRHVVPYNPYLMLKYQAHINMEWCNQSSSVKYLFKYINKGYDRITASISSNSAPGDNIDEIKQYLDCRYVSACEASWRIFSFPIHCRKPAVERLFFHLEGEQSVFWRDYEDIDQVLLKPSITESMFTAWFQANESYVNARSLTYGQFVSHFVYVKSSRMWKPRTKGYTIGRIIWVPPSTGELFYLRMMLTHVKGPKSYKELRTVGDVTYPTFREACFQMGFLNDDTEWIDTIKEAHVWGNGYFLRQLFVTMLLSSSINRPDNVWKETWKWLCDGILYDQRKISQIQGLQLTDEELQNLTLLEIEKLLQGSRKSIKDYPGIPFPTGYVTYQLGNRLIHEERNYNKEELKKEFDTLYISLTDEQRAIFDKIIKAINENKGGVFFLYGYGGTGKTFIWTTLAAYLRSQGHIVLTVASSGIASLLLPGGRTAHSKFKIPVPTCDNSTCNIHGRSELAELLKQTRLIIWDEAPMAHRYCFEALDRTLKDIMNSTKPFGGKVVVFGGDFRQILPVIPRGSRSDIIHASINASYIWQHCQVLTLTKNMRLRESSTNSNTEELKIFSQWILNVGDGKINEPNDGYAEVEIPEELLIKPSSEPIHEIVSKTYQNIIENYKDGDFLQKRAILASTCEVVEQINDYVLGLIPGDEKEYLSADTVDRSEVQDDQAFGILTPEFLNSLATSGLPNHKIKIKIGTPIMLLRNLDQSQGLCNGTRLSVTRIANHVLEAKIISGKNIGNIIYIPRMCMSPSQSPWPFKLIRRQFPIIVSFAMTINKSQGQSLDYVGLYLPKSVFNHGQLYVALSRVKSKDGLKVLIVDKENQSLTTTTNVVFKEVFQNVK